MSLLYDVELYAALACGLALARVISPPAWSERSSRATVLCLVGSLGVLLSGVGPIDPVRILLPGLLLAAGLVLGSAAMVRVLGDRSGRFGKEGAHAASSPDWGKRLRFPLLIVAALLVGYVVGTLAPSGQGDASWVLDAALLLLLFQVGWTVRLTWASVRGVPRPLAASLIVTMGLGLVAAFALDLPWNVGLALVAGFGWYSLAGPLVAQVAGPTLGLLAFVINFLREDLTMLAAPWLGSWSGAEGIVASGGATSMDTTLFFATTYGRPDAAGLALACGTLLTLAAPLLLGALLGTF